MTKVFYTDEIETHALSGIHLSVKKGEYVAMSGPSGCGKSTLLSIIGLLDTPTAGRYMLNGKAVENLDFAERSRIRNQEIGFIFQSFNLIGDLTVYENVELPLTYRQKMPSAERKPRVMEALERVGMAHRVRHYPSQLSGGQQQRVAVARALGGKPSILLADEPTGNLDSRNGEAVMELLQNLHREGATICMVTHDPRFAKHAQREVHLFDGKVVAERAEKADGGSVSVNILLQDIRYALRQLHKMPGFACLAIVILALGIGGTTAIFSAVSPILFEPLPYPHASRIVMLWYAGDDGSRIPQTFHTFQEVAERSRSFDSIAVMKAWQPTLTAADQPERLDGQKVSSGYFRTLGVPPLLGRDFQRSDDVLHGPQVVILSNEAWKTHFGANSTIIGREISLTTITTQSSA